MPVTSTRGIRGVKECDEEGRRKSSNENPRKDVGRSHPVWGLRTGNPRAAPFSGQCFLTFFCLKPHLQNKLYHFAISSTSVKTPVRAPPRPHASGRSEGVTMVGGTLIHD